MCVGHDLRARALAYLDALSKKTLCVWIRTQAGNVGLRAHLFKQFYVYGNVFLLLNTDKFSVESRGFLNGALYYYTTST